MRHLEPITETAYLTAVNAPRYRKIMRIFFVENEKMHYRLYKEDVLERLRREEGYEEYPMEQLKQDLDALVEWKNLTPLQDPRRVYTIADYKNKQFRYTMSERAVEIERLTVRLENLLVETGSLSTNLFVRLTEGLASAHHLKDSSLKELNEWWKNLQEDFKRLNQNYKDYLREFYSGKSEKLLKSIEFIVHKDRFIAYLREFIQELQRHANRISVLLEKESGLIESVLLERVIASELEIPHALSEQSESREERIREAVYGKWDTLKGWFLGSEGAPSESEQILEITNDIIRTLIQNASLIVQMQNWGISRKEDYLKFLELFSNCSDLDEAHKLSAHVFGVQQIAHLKANGERSTDKISSSVYEEPAMEYLLKPHTRSYKPRKDRQGFADQTMEKLAQKNRYLRKLDEERHMVLQYIRGGKLDISSIEGVVPETVRITLLRWISQAALSSSKQGQTEYGQAFRLVQKPGTCVLNCEDGDLTMPAYVLEFEE